MGFLGGALQAQAIRPFPAPTPQIQVELQTLTKRLAAINESLARKIDTKVEYDKASPHARKSDTSRLPHCALLQGVGLAHYTHAAVRSHAAADPAGRALRAMQPQVIQETEGAYLKILESSQTLLTVLKRESVSMTRRRG